MIKFVGICLCVNIRVDQSIAAHSYVLAVLTILLWSLAMATPSVGDDPAAVKEERDDDILSEVDSDGSDEGSLSDGTAFTQSTRTTVNK